MNKQAFAFLTLFTLILMLSIYYVTLPADQGQLNPDQLLTGQNEDQDSLATMQQQLQDKHNAQAQNSQAIVASPSASTEEKQDALQQAGQVEQNRKTEETIVAALSQAGRMRGGTAGRGRADRLSENAGRRRERVQDHEDRRGSAAG